MVGVPDASFYTQMAPIFLLQKISRIGQEPSRQPVIFRLGYLICLACLLVAYNAQAQQVGLSRLFYANATLRADYLVPVSTEGQEFGLTRTSMLGIIPIQSEVQAGFSLRKKFDLRAVHTVLLAQYTQNQPLMDGLKVPDSGFKTMSVSAIRLQASLKDRLWVYGAGLGMTESNETLFTPQPFFWGGAARMRLIGLKSQVLYGSVLTYNQKLRFVPVFGLNQRLSKEWRLTTLLPFMLSVNYHPTKWYSFDFLSGVGGYSGGFQLQTQEERRLFRQNYQQLKLGIAANVHALTVFNISAEAGVAGFRQLRTFNDARQTLDTAAPPLTPYVGVSVRYLTSQSKFSSKFISKLGLGGGKGAGINW